MSTKFKPTDEQERCIESSRLPGAIAVEALAGAGKTATLTMMSDEMKGRGLYVAFNKSIVTEAQAKFPAHVEPRTAHSLAYRAVGYRYARKLKNETRTSWHQVARWLGCEPLAIGSEKDETLTKVGPERVAKWVWRSIDRFLHSPDLEPQRYHVPVYNPAIPTEYQRDAQDYVATFLRKAWDDLADTHVGFMRFTHDCYLKLWQLSRPKLPVDFILFDEAQDADPVMLAVVLDQKAQQVWVGDRHQAIYEWRGACNAMEKVKVDRREWITMSFRFGAAIAERANQFLSLLESERMVRGNPRVESVQEQIEMPDAILCRTNAGVIGEAMRCIDAGISVAVVGGLADVMSFAKAARGLMNGEAVSYPILESFASWDALLAALRDVDSDDLDDLRTMVNLVEKYGPDSLIDLAGRCSTERNADLILSTAHKAKGLEWDAVRIGQDFASPEDMNTAELRLAYVACTRAKRRLDATAFDVEPEGDKSALDALAKESK